MAACIDLTGMKFGRLTVIERAGKTKQGNALEYSRSLMEEGNEE